MLVFSISLHEVPRVLITQQNLLVNNTRKGKSLVHFDYQNSL